MPFGRQGTTTHVIASGTNAMVPPLTGTRAGTVNAAGGLVTNIDARGYKSGTLYVYSGGITGAVAGKVQDSATSGGSYADLSGASVTGTANQAKGIDFDIVPGRPWLQIVLTATNAADVSSAWIELHNPTAINRP